MTSEVDFDDGYDAGWIACILTLRTASHKGITVEDALKQLSPIEVVNLMHGMKRSGAEYANARFYVQERKIREVKKMNDSQIIKMALKFGERIKSDTWKEDMERIFQKALSLKEIEMKKKHEKEIRDYLAEIQRQRRQIERMKNMEKKGWMP